MQKDIYGDNWEIDKLNRRDEANFLTTYLIEKSKIVRSDLNDGSFVLNINAEWGFGKTYFLNNWADDLAKKGHPVVYFDAWQNDFSKEPLIAFISTINSQLEPYFNGKLGEKRATRVKYLLRDWYDKGKKIINPASPFLWSILAKKLAGMSIQQLGTLFEEDIEDTAIEIESHDESGENGDVENVISTVVSKAASNLLTAHNSTKKTIVEFRNSLERLTNHLESLELINTPIFIFVDELDRCRPNYAVELLENIKHLFGVPKVFFIVATASVQLCHSIKKIYGQDFDSPNYLKRFFDQTYTLQEPNRHSFSEYLFNHYKLDNRDNLFSPLDQNIFKGKNTKIEAFAFMADALDLGLRDMIQYCLVIDSVCLTFKKAPVHLIYLLFLIRLKEVRKDLYDQIVAGIGFPDKEILSISKNMSFTIDTCAPSGPHSHIPSKITAHELICGYIRLLKTDLNSLYESSNRDSNKKHIISAVEGTLKTEMPRSYPAGTKPNHHLSYYPKLIEQAGRIT